MKFLGRTDRVLSGHRISDEENLRRIQQFPQRLHLIHELIVDVQSARGVNKEDVASGHDGFATRFFDEALYGSGVRLADFSFVDVTLDRLRDDLQLLARRGTVDVDRYEQWAMSALLQPVGELARCRGFTGTLQSRHQNDRGRLRGELYPRGVSAED